MKRTGCEYLATKESRETGGSIRCDMSDLVQAKPNLMTVTLLLSTA